MSYGASYSNNELSFNAPSMSNSNVFDERLLAFLDEEDVDDGVGIAAKCPTRD